MNDNRVKEFLEGLHSTTNVNPYDFFDDYEKHYNWSNGYQKRKQNELKD